MVGAVLEKCKEELTTCDFMKLKLPLILSKKKISPQKSLLMWVLKLSYSTLIFFEVGILLVFKPSQSTWIERSAN
jgi:hypothetical protein